MRDILTDMMSAYDNKGDNNMTTVQQLISWLQTLPQDASVEVLGLDYHNEPLMLNLDIEDCSVITYVKNGLLQHKSIVQLCGD
jgi:hypothetical protein